MFSKKKICEDCGTIGNSKRKAAGSGWVELLLWILGFIFAAFTVGISLLVPLAYTLNRTFGSTYVCKKCDGKLIDVDTPKGKKLIKDLDISDE